KLPTHLPEAFYFPQGGAHFFVPQWVQGFTNRNVGFVTKRTVCYPCGNYIIFVNLETLERSILRCHSGKIEAFAVNPNQNVVAYSDRQLKPVIHIHSYPGLKRQAKLKGQASLDYTLLAFSYTGPYLASYSSIPDFTLTIWDWNKKVILCSQSQMGVEVTAMSFNPMSWHQLCLYNGTSVTLWTIERNNEEHILKSKSVRLPAEDGTLADEQNSFFSHPMDNDPYFGPILPNSAIAGLVGDEAETFKPKDDIQPYVHPTSHCWTQISDLYMGCEEGYCLKIGADTFKATVIHQNANPSGYRRFIASDGVVRLYKIKGNSFQMEDCLEVEEPITNLIFSPDYFYLLVETEKVYCERQKNDECINERGQLKERVIQTRGYELEYALSSVVKRKDSTVFGYATQAPFICKYHLTSKPIIFAEKTTPSKQFGRGFLELSAHGKWLASASESGLLFIHDVLTREYCHSYHGQGIRSLAFSLDGQHILVNGMQDGALVCLKWKYTSEILPKVEPLKAVWLSHPCPLYVWTSTLHLHFLQTHFEPPSLILYHLKKQIQDMMFENAMVPKNEMLEQYEFNLDVEEQDRQQVHSEAEVARVKKDIEMENLANCYLREIIKQECWDTMSVKGRSVKAFHSSCEVQNYPMKEQSPEEQYMLERVCYLKKIESIDLKLRRQIVEFESQPSVIEGEKTEEGEKQEEEKVDALVGSLSSLYGGNTSTLYHQLEVHTREEKINQILLLRNIIYNVKSHFNKEFDAVIRMKDLEIARVQERNVRIAEILMQLELQEEIWVPVLSEKEKPDQALIILDSEIKVEKYLTPLQKAKEKIMSRVHYKRRLAAQEDNARERGLMDMMNGVLEIKKEDILKMEIPAPAFTVKQEALWNEDERKIYKEYEKKVKELNEEREKHRKILDTELRKLQSSIQETTQSFDEIVTRLFEKKVNSEMVIYQEELKITNLLYSLLLDEELSTREAGLHHYLNKKRKEKVISNEAVKTSRAEVDAHREAYDILVVEDKLMERGFRKEFSDLPTHHIDQLFKLYKRRPRAKVPADSANPYGERPGSAEALKAALAHLMKGIDEMDEPENKPEGLDLPNWERFCEARRAKVESEQMVKQKALILAEMQTFLQKRTEDDERLRNDIEQVFAELNLLREQKMTFQLDLMVQFLFKQGQVELEGTNLIPDYRDAILISRTIIEELNSVIRAQGERKVASMVESKDFRKGIFQLEWEHKKMRMQVDDLNQKARDIQKLNVTKHHQIVSYLNHEVSIMEGTLNFLDKVHKKNVQQCETVMKELEKQISVKDVANRKLSKELQEMLVIVSERRHINEATGESHLKDYQPTLDIHQDAKEISVLSNAKLELVHVSISRMRTVSMLFPQCSPLNI
uniref:Cilia- and flagella-associated protein 43 n=1 Tax=Podarcis muralis TaxID=64176 RepID=A0A670I0J7_PODMU